MLNDRDEWLSPLPRCPFSVGHCSACQPANGNHFFHSGLLLKPWTWRGRRWVSPGAGTGAVGKGGRREVGRLNQLAEERKLCHIQEEVWVSDRTFFGTDSVLAQEVGNALCWALTPAGKEPCLARRNRTKDEDKPWQRHSKGKVQCGVEFSGSEGPTQSW